mmetsp:Transcript_15112/g.54424  ORF Transcript_15112/g.54424 Transcript_15112/m.54424 type:complete len:239 (+) Transcript_15112:301-1017(+)
MINTEEEVTQCTGEIENNFSSRVEPRRVTVNQAGTRLPTGVEPEAVDVTVYYTRAEDLTPLHSPGCEATALLVQINSVNWTTVCSALTTARRLAIYHPNELKLVLDTVMPHLKLHIASLRSSVCKTALICATDFLKAFGELMFIHLQSGSPSLLAILLQKAALDKRFVMDEAKRTLSMMINAMPCKVLLNMLFLHVRDTNCKVRAIVAKYLTETVEKALCERERGIEVWAFTFCFLLV